MPGKYGKPNTGRSAGDGAVNLATARKVAEKPKKGGINKSYTTGHGGMKGHNSDMDY